MESTLIFDVYIGLPRLQWPDLENREHGGWSDVEHDFSICTTGSD